MVSYSSQSEESDSSVTKIPLTQKPFFPKLKNKFSRIDLNETMDDNISHSSSNRSSSQDLPEKEKENEQQLKYRTELCKFYEINGQCKFGDNCIFAHGKENLREKVLTKSGYKKRACINFFEHGFCMYGNRCQFSHEVKQRHNKYINNFSYKNFFKEISKGNFDSNIVYEIKEKPRLNIFLKISKTKTKEKNKKKNQYSKRNKNKNKKSSNNNNSTSKKIFVNNESDYYINDIIKLCDEKN